MSGRPLEGYNAYYDGNDFVLKIRKPLKINSNNPLKGIKIAINNHAKQNKKFNKNMSEKFKTINGIDEDEKGLSLGIWIRKQRVKYKNKTLKN